MPGWSPRPGGEPLPCAHGLAAGDVVAVCAGRSVQQVLAVAGILAAGAAVAPFPAQQAAGSTRAALARLAPRLALADEEARGLHTGALPLDPPAAPGSEGRSGPVAPGTCRTPVSAEQPGIRSADRLAYVLHTSGTSGRPKAVHVPHSAVRNRFSWGQVLYPIGPGDTVLYSGSLVFDCQIWVVLAPLCHGATLLVAPEGAEGEPHRLAGLARQHRATVMHFVPSLLREFLAAGAGYGLADLSYLLVAGERLPGELAARISAATRARVINQYGPTETCIEVLNHELTGQDAEADAVPIGRPIPGVRAVVRDEQGHPVPPAAQANCCSADGAWPGGTAIRRRRRSGSCRTRIPPGRGSASTGPETWCATAATESTSSSAGSTTR
ncbi:AMP-binding protein [Streptomyces sp. NPDC007083]|uniref:AMP-binding protein n=1 Tax=unclassified Streptomyces TaxID=2593676 RepID=UPI0033E30DFA